MINKCRQNKNLQINSHELHLINKLKQLSTQSLDSPTKKTFRSASFFLSEKKPKKSYLECTQDYLQQKQITNKNVFLKWNNYFLFNNPINILFSIDEFLFEFAKKKPQRRKSSEFIQQLKERKKLSLFYGTISKKQLEKLINQAKIYQGYFNKNFFSLIERRLDIVLYRSGLVKNIVTAKHLISHKKILVNNQIINRASYIVNPGDIIYLKKEKNTKTQIANILNTQFKKRSSRFTLSQNFLYRLQNIKKFKNYKQKKIIQNYIGLLLAKVEKRTFLKIKSKHLENKLNFSLLKFKPLISKQAHSFLLMSLQKNYFSPNKKPIFQNKYTRFLNLVEASGINKQKVNSRKTSVSYFHSEKKTINQKLRSFFDKKKTNNLGSNLEILKKTTKNLENRKQGNSMFKRTLYSSSILFSFKIGKFEQKSQKHFFQKSKNNYQQKKRAALYRNIVYKTLLQMHSTFFYSVDCSSFFEKKRNNYFGSKSLILNQNRKKRCTNTLLTLKLKKHVIRKRSRRQILRTLRFCGKKPVHIEVSYSLSTAILLYSPQRLNFPFYLDVDLILRSFSTL